MAGFAARLRLRLPRFPRGSTCVTNPCVPDTLGAWYGRFLPAAWCCGIGLGLGNGGD